MSTVQGEISSARRAKGTNLIELVKTLRVARKSRELTFPSMASEALLEERILHSGWYSHEAFVELLQVAYEHLLGGNEANAYRMGLVSGRTQLLGVHKLYVITQDPAATLLAMRHSWRSMFSFGTLTNELEGSDSVLFTLLGYQDLTPVHGAMILGWCAAAGQLAGAPAAEARALERPWEGARHYRFRVTM